MKNTKTKLISSVSVLLICFAMLIGSTFAWFTDSASTGVNKIQAGTLDVSLKMANAWDSNGKPTNWVNAEGASLAWRKASGAPSEEATLWEPGVTYELPLLKITNLGNLETQFQVQINGITGKDKNGQPSTKLLEVLDFEVAFVQIVDYLDDPQIVDNSKSSFNGTSLQSLPYTIENPSSLAETNLGLTGLRLKKLESGENGGNTYYVRIRAQMDDSANNNYQGLSLENIGITVVATQCPAEHDSFDNTYDKYAEYPNVAAAYVTTSNGEVSSPVKVSTATKNADGDPIATVTIPAGVKVADGVNTITTTVEPTTTPSTMGDIAVTSDSQTFEVKAEGLADGNDMPLKIEAFIGKNLSNVTLLHNGQGMTKKDNISVLINDQDYCYDRDSGYVTFLSKSFSPFTATYDKDTWKEESVSVSDGVAEVSNGGQLAWALDNVNSSNISEILITENIDLSSYLWGAHTINLPSDKNLTINGNNKTISGLVATNGYVYGYDAYGLIADINSGNIEIKNLTVSDAYVKAPVGENYLDTAGVIVGYFLPWPGTLTFTNCKVDNCTVESNMYAAGLVGYVGGSTYDENKVIINGCEVINSSFTGNDATGALIALNNHKSIINGATVTGNTINGGNGWSAAALVGTSQANTTATGVTVSDNFFSITNSEGKVYNETYGYIFRASNTSYSVNNSEITD